MTDPAAACPSSLEDDRYPVPLTQTLPACGTDMGVLYPIENMCIGGAMVSSGGTRIREFPAGTPQLLQSFPIRNRIIVGGFSLGVFPRGAAECSCPVIAAGCAPEQGRDASVASANRANRDSLRPITLIRQGARLTVTWQNAGQRPPAEVRLQLKANRWVESPKPAESSVFSDLPPSPPQDADLLS